MGNLWEFVLKFYQEHENMAMVLLGSIGTFIVTKIGPWFFDLLGTIINWIRRKIGGRQAYKAMQTNYLNWVVLQNEDLNLTGIVGSGEKPKLEQVFISLNVFPEIKDEETESLENQINQKFEDGFITKLKSIQQKWIGIKHSILGKDEYGDLIYSHSKYWRFFNFFTRDGINSITGIVLFYIFPLFVFFIPIPYVTKVLIFILNIFWTLTGIGVLYLAQEKFRDEFIDRISVIITCFIIQVFLTIEIFIYIYIHGVIPSYISLALILGIFFSLPGIGDKSGFFEKYFKNIPISKDVRILLKNDQIAILGKPGSGKSTYLQFLALTFAQQKAAHKYKKRSICKKRFGSNLWLLPILIPLRKISKHIVQNKDKMLNQALFEAYRQQVLPSNVKDDFPDDFLEYFLKKKKCLLLFDGLDEVADENEFKLITNEIKGLVSQYPGNKFIITSRHAGWRGGVGSSFKQYEVNDLTNGQIEIFIDSWYQAVGMNLAQSKSQQHIKSKDRAGKLKEALKDVPSIRKLAQNPLLLSMICFVHHSKTLPRERLSLYKDCTRLLLEQWDIEKGLPQDDVPLIYERKEILMQEIAFALHSGKIGHESTEQKEASGDEIIPIIQSVLNRFKMDLKLAEPLFYKLVERTGLIVITEKYKGLYSFSHLTFQEYFTAKYLHEGEKDIFSFVKASGGIESLTGWWKEVFLLYGMMKKDPTNLIHELCKNENNDKLHREIQIASQCLVEAIEPPQENAEQLLLGQILEIRSLGKYNAYLKTSFDPFIRDYLMRYVQTNWKFYRDVLNFEKNQKNINELHNFAEKLSILIKSSNFDIRNEAAGIFFILEDDYKKQLIIDSDTLFNLVDNEYFWYKPNIISWVRSVNYPLSDNEVSLLVDKIVRSLQLFIMKDKKVEFRPSKWYKYYNWRNQAARFHQIFDTYNALKETFPTVKKRSVSFLISEIANFTHKKMFHYKSSVFYRGHWGQFLKRYLLLLIKILIDWESSTGRSKHCNHLLDMLEKGSFQQQKWAIIFLCNHFQEYETVTGKLLDKRFTPHSGVRDTLLGQIRKLRLDDKQIEKLCKEFETYFQEDKWIIKVLSKLRQIFLGIGKPGLTKTERDQIVGTLFHWGYLSKKKFISYFAKVTSEDEKTSVWVLCEILEDCIGKLNENDLEKIIVHYKENIDNQLLLIEAALRDYDNLPKTFKIYLVEKLMECITDDDETVRYRAMYYLNELRFSITKGSDHYNKIRICLKDKDFNIANWAFGILLKNDLVI